MGPTRIPPTHILVAIFAALAFTACGDVDSDEAVTDTLVTSDTGSIPSTTDPIHPDLPTESCDSAFQEASRQTEDSLERLFPAARDCSSLVDWIAAAEAHPEAVGDADPAELAQDVCQASVDLTATPLCHEVLR